MKIFLLILGFVASVLAQGACPGTSNGLGKRVFCYYEGRRSPSEIDPCPCTHLVYKNIQINQYSQVRITDRVTKDISQMKKLNPHMSILLSVGGQEVKGEVFRSIVARKEQLTNFTKSLNSLYQENVIQGMELDWEWPLDTDDKKDKIKLVRYLRQMKLATGAENVHRRIVRSAESTTTEAQFTTTVLYDVETEDAPAEITENQTFISDDILYSETTTEWSPQRELEEEKETTTHDIEETTHNWHARGYKRKRVKGGKKSPAEIPDTETPDYEERNSLEDVLFTEEDNFIEDSESKEFFIALRLSPDPEQLVKGYEFKMLNKFVDMYSMSTHNFTGKYQNMTYHHSRLMGVSDIQNSDALIDVVVGLGAPIEKLILTAPAFGSSFTLLDKTNNLPGSSTSGPSQSVTYQQVCQILSKGNWTIERDEDLTGPYSYFDKKWVAFEDDTSLKIKSKYVLLRDLAGIGLMSIDADDVDNVCGKGKHSLLRTIGNIIYNLQRKPRQLIVTSLEQDLLATAQNIVPVTSAPGLRLSPFRVVRIVDREGQITSIRQNSETILECSRQGYYRHPEDCSRFYRCVKFNQYENDYTIFEYGCPDGLVFDDRWEVCVWPSQATPCDGSSEIFPIPKNDYVCPGEGFFVDPENCRWFYACRDHHDDGTYTHYEFRCPFGLAFDESNLRCEWPWLVSECDNTGGQIVTSQQLPSRKEIASNYSPAGNRSPFPSVPTIPNFESARTAIPENNSNRHIGFSGKGGKDSGTGPTFPRGGRQGFGKQKPLEGTIAKDSCENCFSPVLTITGRGHTNRNGIEVADDEPRGGRDGPLESGSNLLNSYQIPANQYSTPVAPSYVTQPPVIPLKSPPTYKSRIQPSSGYEYPVPSIPLQYPSTTQKPKVPTTSYKKPINSQQPTYSPSTIKSVDNVGYNYLIPANPLPIGIAVYNTGENGILPSNNGKPNQDYTVSPPIPLYGQSSPSYPTSPSVLIQNPTVSTTYSPLVSSTYSPSLPRTQAPVIISSTFSPAYKPASKVATNYNVPRVPTAAYTIKPSLTVPLSNNYGIPAGPVISPTYESLSPLSQSLPAYSPHSTTVSSFSPSTKSTKYGLKTKPVLVSSTFGPIQSSTEAPLLDEFYDASLPQYYDPSEPQSAPALPAVSTTLPPKPLSKNHITPFISSYGQNNASPNQYVESPLTYNLLPEKKPSPPSKSYGVPLASVITSSSSQIDDYSDSANDDDSFGFGLSEEYNPSEPKYAPAVPVVSTTYRPKSYATKSSHRSKTQQNGSNKKPSNTYGVPVAPVVSSTYQPVSSYSPSSTTESYGVPSAPLISSTIAPIDYEDDYLPSYSGKDQQSSYTNSRPAGLPDNWPKYPTRPTETSGYKELPSPPEIKYGGFKPPFIPDPIRYSPVYQQPRYSNYPYKQNVGYGGFKPVPSYSKPKTILTPYSPTIPLYNKSKPNTGYSYPVPKTPLTYPPKKKPIVVTTKVYSYGSSSPSYSQTGKSYNPTTPNLQAYGPSLIASVTVTVSPVSNYNPSTPNIYVDVAINEKKETSEGNGYKYPIPNNPLELPNRKGKQGLNNKPIVASVNPSGFTSATLSNGPFSSISSSNGNVKKQQRKQKAFNGFLSSNKPKLTSNNRSKPNNNRNLPSGKNNGISRTTPKTKLKGDFGKTKSFSGQDTRKPNGLGSTGSGNTAVTLNRGQNVKTPHGQTNPNLATKSGKNSEKKQTKNTNKIASTFNGHFEISSPLPTGPSSKGKKIEGIKNIGLDKSNSPGRQHGEFGGASQDKNKNSGTNQLKKNNDRFPGNRGAGSNQDSVISGNGNLGRVNKFNGGVNNRGGKAISTKFGKSKPKQFGADNNRNLNSNLNQGFGGSPSHFVNIPTPPQTVGGSLGIFGLQNLGSRGGVRGNTGNRGQLGFGGNIGNVELGKNKGLGEGLDSSGINGFGDFVQSPVNSGNGGFRGNGENLGNSGRGGFRRGEGFGRFSGANKVGLPGNSGRGGFGGNPGSTGRENVGVPGNSGRGGLEVNGGNPRNPQNRGFGGNGGNPGSSGSGDSMGKLGNPGRGGFGGNGGSSGNSGNGGFRGDGGNPGNPGRGGFGGNGGSPGNPGNGGFRGNGGNPGNPGRGGFGGNGGSDGNSGRGGAGGSGGSSGRGGKGGSPGNSAGKGFSGNNRVNGAFDGNVGLFNGFPKIDTDTRRGKNVGGFGADSVTSVRRPVQHKTALLGKVAGNNWSSGNWQKFGPGGFRNFNETLGPEVCQRPGLFRHPTDCTQFYECYWDKWIEKFTLHIFPCPVAMAVRQYDDSISACNWPFLGPNCEGNTVI